MNLKQQARKNLSDAEVNSAMEAVFRTQGRITGRSVRQYLQQHRGQPGSVARIYRMVSQFQADHASLDSTDPQEALVAGRQRIQTLEEKVASLEAELQDALLREERHSARWLCEIDTLRTQVQETSTLRRQLSNLQEANLRLHREQVRYRNEIDSLSERLRDQPEGLVADCADDKNSSIHGRGGCSGM